MHRIVWGLLLGAALFAGTAGAATQAPPDPRAMPATEGSAKAPVKIDEYFSLDCPHCAEFDIGTLPQIKSDYVDKGLVQITFHDFPLHEISLHAAMLAHCVSADRYLPMMETLFKVQRGWVLQDQDAAMAALKQQAKFAGMSDGQIDACLADHGLEDALLDQRLQAGNTLKIDATPTFIFNGDPTVRIEGDAPYAQFKDKIDSLLKK